VRLSEWSSLAPAGEAVSATVTAVVAEVLATLGAAADPECWVTWGEEPAARWGLLAPTEAGLAVVAVRVNVPQEGPRASGKLVRWSRVQVGDFAVEMQSGHRFVSTTVEGSVLRGMDDDADRVGAFVQAIFRAIDGRLPADVADGLPGARSESPSVPRPGNGAA
jgi:hypothetical protein